MQKGYLLRQSGGVPFRHLERCSAVVVAAVNGICHAGGLDLVLHCDMAIATTDARFGLTEVRLGLAPATIAPFVIGKIGPGAMIAVAGALMLADAGEAGEILARARWPLASLERPARH